METPANRCSECYSNTF